MSLIQFVKLMEVETEFYKIPHYETEVLKTGFTDASVCYINSLF